MASEEEISAGIVDFVLDGINANPDPDLGAPGPDA